MTTNGDIIPTLTLAIHIYMLYIERNTDEAIYSSDSSNRICLWEGWFYNSLAMLQQCSDTKPTVVTKQ